MGNKVRREKIRRYQLFNELKSKGYSIREIARKTGMDSSNIRRHQEIRLDKLLTANQWSIIKHIEQISEGIAAGTMTGEQDIISHYKDVEGTDLRREKLFAGQSKRSASSASMSERDLV